MVKVITVTLPEMTFVMTTPPPLGKSGRHLNVGVLTANFYAFQSHSEKMEIKKYFFVSHAFFSYEQGDQIGRIFAHWAIVYFGQCFENYSSSANF
jgi:hypothetical protein